jgi:hypothetical protein
MISGFCALQTDCVATSRSSTASNTSRTGLETAARFRATLARRCFVGRPTRVPVVARVVGQPGEVRTIRVHRRDLGIAIRGAREGDPGTVGRPGLIDSLVVRSVPWATSLEQRNADWQVETKNRRAGLDNLKEQAKRDRKDLESFITKRR